MYSVNNTMTSLYNEKYCNIKMIRRRLRVPDHSEKKIEPKIATSIVARVLL